MKPELECRHCILQWVYGRAVLQNENINIPHLYSSITQLLEHNINGSTNIGALCNEAVDLIGEFMEPRSLFWDEIKKKTNIYVKTVLPKATAYIEKAEKAEKKLERAFCVAAMGNVAPLGALSEALDFSEEMNMIEGNGPAPVLIGDICKVVDKAQNILYVTDNAGEIGFDSLVLSKLKEMDKKVTVVVKEHAYFEDATMEDAIFYSVQSIADEVCTTNKVFVPGKNRQSVDQAFSKSDLLIIKGTGNYEALKGETKDKAAIFMLKVKCDPVVRNTGVKKGEFAVICDG